MGKINKEYVEQMILQDARQSSYTFGLSYLLESFNSDNLDHQKLAEIIGHFPSIASRLLFVANSAWASPRIPIESLDMACSRLGLSLVQSISVALCVSSTFNPTQCKAFDAKHHWSTALLVADGAGWLVSCTKKPTKLDEKVMRTAGLLHNLGLLWLADKCPEITSQALETITIDCNVSTLEALRTTVGTDYCEVGGVLGHAWALPTVLVTAMAQHNNHNYSGTDYQGALFVGYAADLAMALFQGINVKERPEFAGKGGLYFNSSDLDKVYLKLANKLDDYQELAQILFPNS